LAGPAPSAAATSTATTAAPTSWPTTSAAAVMAAVSRAVRMRVIVRMPFDGHIDQLRRDSRGGNLVADIMFDIGQRHGEFLARETNRVAFGARTRRAAYAMHVIRGVLR
jgi:hypothetical protein